jgi:hypothetical protein
MQRCPDGVPRCGGKRLCALSCLPFALCRPTDRRQPLDLPALLRLQEKLGNDLRMGIPHSASSFSGLNHGTAALVAAPLSSPLLCPLSSPLSRMHRVRGHKPDLALPLPDRERRQPARTSLSQAQPAALTHPSLALDTIGPLRYASSHSSGLTPRRAMSPHPPRPHQRPSVPASYIRSSQRTRARRDHYLGPGRLRRHPRFPRRLSWNLCHTT